jgi:iron complex outermembrane receptor protein
MKKLWFLFYLCLVINLINAQNLNLKVIDDVTSKPIEDAHILFLDMDLLAITDNEGLFNYKYELPKVVQLYITKPGYESCFLELSNDHSELIMVRLKELHLQLDEVIVSTSKSHNSKNSTINIQSRKLKELNIIPGSLTESISRIAGVDQVSTGPGITKPVIRGLSGMRIVTYLNGMRIENQQWGGDHGIGITDLGIGKVELIKGPSSLMYGPDAMGGVLYFIDEPYSFQDNLEVGTKTRFESNTMGIEEQVYTKYNKGNIRFNLYGQFSNHADYSVPGDDFVNNTRFSNYNLKGSLGYSKDSWITHIRYNFLNGSYGIPSHSEDDDHGHGHSHASDSHEFLAEEQERLRITPYQSVQNHFLTWNNKFHLKRGHMVFNVGRGANSLKEFEDETDPEIQLDLTSINMNVYLNTNIDDRWNLILGHQNMFQKNRNSKLASDELIPDANTNDIGIYGILNFKYDNWHAQSGIRLDNRSIEAFNIKPENNTIERSYDAFNFSVGISRAMNSSDFRISVSNAFRAPHSSELLSDGIHHGSMRYEVGNIDLNIEKATQLDVLYEFSSDHVGIIINPYINQINDYIFLNPLDSIIDDVPVYEYTQDGLARLSGSDFSLHYHPHFAHNLHFATNISFIKGEDRFGDPIPLIPQNKVNSNMKFEFDSDRMISLDNIVLEHIYSAIQDRVVDNETQSNAYNLINLGVNLKLQGKINGSLSFGVKNILDERYIDHLSRLKTFDINNAGRNYYVQLAIRIFNPLKKND